MFLWEKESMRDYSSECKPSIAFDIKFAKKIHKNLCQVLIDIIGLTDICIDPERILLTF